MNDFFENKRKLDKSGITDVFTPSTPINSNLFCGRSNETDSILKALTTKGEHVILYGDRGVGKTSLAKYCCTLCTQQGMRVLSSSCTSTSTFSSEINKIFEQLGIVVDKESIVTHRSGIDAKIANLGTERQTKTTKYSAIDDPNWVASKLNGEGAIILFDEFDMMTNKDESKKFSQLMKSMSDQSSESHIFVVGIALSVDDLIDGHKSIDRCLTQIKLDRMNDDELYEIIQKGEERTEICFNLSVKNIIVEKSLGFPYFTHSLSLESASNAILNDRKNVEMEDLKIGISKAIDSAKTSFETKYKTATRDNMTKRKILFTAAMAGAKGEFTMKDWIREYYNQYGEEIQNVTINSNMQKVISKDHSGLIWSIHKGSYVFADSRMPCYIALLGKPE